jgi:hypothetical protein
MRKTIEQLDRNELIGMVHVLQSQVEELTSPERTRLYQLGRLHAQTEPAEEKRPSLWQRLAPGRVLGKKKRVRLDAGEFRNRNLAPR